ncbi:MAG: hypothetical protein PW788_09040 [Micavibrio sp.]|nr:hypothetical protein [Micavibrio sp.]
MQAIIDIFSALHANTTLVFGLFLLCGVCGGMVATRIKWMPTITAFMLLGFIIGPHCLGLITTEMLHASQVLTQIALGLILYKLGNMLHPQAMLKSRKLMMSSLFETLFSFMLPFLLMLAFHYDIVLSALIGAIAVSSSPAVLVHVSEELGAKGPVTDRAKSLVALNNLFSFIIFSAVIPFALVGADQGLDEVLALPLYRLLGAGVIGTCVAWLSIRMSRSLHVREQHYRFAIVIGSVMLTIGLCGMLNMSALLAPLVLGIATRWFESAKHNLSRIGLGEGGDLFYIVLFVMAGAKIDLVGLWSLGLLPLCLVLVRSCGKISGIFLSSFYTQFERPQLTATSLLLIPMAGMAIGLVATTTNMLPEIGAKISTIVFAMVAIFETVGPFAAAHAFKVCGEADETEEEGTSPG